MKHATRITIFLLVLILAIAVVFLLRKQTSVEISEEDRGLGIIEDQTDVGIQIGDTAPDFVLRDADGNLVKLSDLRGQPVVLDFWAAWCPFCVNELPELEASSQTYPHVQFLGIHRTSTENRDTGLAFAEDRGVTYTLVFDIFDDVYKTYTGGRSFMPVAFFIHSDGTIADFVYGPKTAEQLQDRLDALN